MFWEMGCWEPGGRRPCSWECLPQTARSLPALPRLRRTWAGPGLGTELAPLVALGRMWGGENSERMGEGGGGGRGQPQPHLLPHPPRTPPSCFCPTPAHPTQSLVLPLPLPSSSGSKQLLFPQVGLRGTKNTPPPPSWSSISPLCVPLSPLPPLPHCHSIHCPNLDSKS